MIYLSNITNYFNFIQPQDFNGKAIGLNILSNAKEVFQNPTLRTGLCISATLGVVGLTAYSFFSRNVLKKDPSITEKEPLTYKSESKDTITPPIAEQTLLKKEDVKVRLGRYEPLLLTSPNAGEERYVFDGILTPEECELFVNFANENKEGFHPSATYSSNTQNPKISENRTSNELSLLPSSTDNDWQSPEIAKCVEKICEVVSSVLNRTVSKVKDDLEELNLVVYEENEGFFKPHFDDGRSLRSRQRELSIVLYLNDVEKGGETHFLADKKSVTPKPGRLLCFNNHPKDKPLEDCCLHEGKVPLKGRKIVIVGFFMKPVKSTKDMHIVSGQRNNKQLPYTLPLLPCEAIEQKKAEEEKIKAKIFKNLTHIKDIPEKQEEVRGIITEICERSTIDNVNELKKALEELLSLPKPENWRLVRMSEEDERGLETRNDIFSSLCKTHHLLVVKITEKWAESKSLRNFYEIFRFLDINSTEYKKFNAYFEEYYLSPSDRYKSEEFCSLSEEDQKWVKNAIKK